MLNDDEIREYISRLLDIENKKVVIRREDVEFLASLSTEDYSKIKFELYLHTSLNNYKIISETKLDEIVRKFIELKVEKLTAKTLFDANLLLPAGYDIDEAENTLVYLPNANIEQVAKPAFYVAQFYYHEGNSQRLIVIRTLHNPPREVEVKLSDNILNKVINAGVLVLDQKLAKEYITKYLKINYDYLAANEIVISAEYILNCIREQYLRQKVKTVHRVLRNGQKVVCFWPSDIETIARHLRISYRKLLALLERESVLIPTSVGERERVVYLSKKERARMVVLDLKALHGENENLAEIDYIPYQENLTA